MTMLLEPTGERAWKCLEKEEFVLENVHSSSRLLRRAKSFPVRLLRFFN